MDGMKKEKKKKKNKKKKKTLYLLPAELCAADQRETNENKNRELGR